MIWIDSAFQTRLYSIVPTLSGPYSAMRAMRYGNAQCQITWPAWLSYALQVVLGWFCPGLWLCLSWEHLMAKQTAMPHNADMSMWCNANTLALCTRCGNPWRCVAAMRNHYQLQCHGVGLLSMHSVNLIDIFDSPLGQEDHFKQRRWTTTTTRSRRRRIRRRRRQYI